MHTEDIVSLDVFKDKWAATGQTATKDKLHLATIYVWEIETKKVLARLKGFHLNAVTHLKFSPNGKKLLTIGGDNDHSVAIYDWARGKLLATSKVDKTRVTCATWKDETSFVTAGLRHVKFWEQKGQNLVS
jgi:echinoderm microtubule-associated protein-like 6